MKPIIEAVPQNFSYGEPLTAEQRRAEWPDAGPDVMLWRALDDRRREQFVLLAPITYHDVAGGRRITVPARFGQFRTDLTSVPSWFTWLVPKSGAHLPAALVHDGLVLDKDGIKTYSTDPDGVIDRIDADRIFRDAMRDCRVDTLRRYLVWAAVSLASLWLGPRASWPTWWRRYYQGLAVLTVGSVVVLGYAATVDLLDLGWASFDVPWMREGGWWAEFYSGLAGAVTIPLVLSVAWGRYAPVAAIAGVAVATLIHVTVAIGVLALTYQAAEWTLKRLLALEGPQATSGDPAERRRWVSLAVWAVVGLVVLWCVWTVVTTWSG
jgi:Protein of unknown function (DUF1353)